MSRTLMRSLLALALGLTALSAPAAHGQQALRSTNLYPPGSSLNSNTTVNIPNGVGSCTLTWDLGSRSTTSGARNPGTRFTDVAPGPGGASYVLVGTSDKVDLTAPSGQQVTVKGQASFVVKLDALGNPLWRVGLILGRPASGSITCITSDETGNLYLGGTLIGASLGLDDVVTGQPSALALSNPAQSQRPFIAKIDPRGSPLWLRYVGTEAAGTELRFVFPTVNDICVDGKQRVFVTGNTREARRSNGVTLLPWQQNAAVYWVRCSDQGFTELFRYATSRAYQLAHGIAASRGLVYICGVMSGSGATFGHLTPTGQGGNDLYLAAYAAESGDVKWAQLMGGSRSEHPVALTTDMQGNAVLAGWMTSRQATFGNVILGSSRGTERALLLKVDSMGQVLWARQAESARGWSKAMGIAVDPNDEILVCGQFEGRNDFGGGMIYTLTGNGSDAFLARYDAGGALISVCPFGGPGDDQASAVTGVKDRGVVVGWFEQRITLLRTLGATGAKEGFAAQFLR